MKTYTHLRKRPDVAEFDEIYDFLAAIQHEITTWWSIPPKENLEAQKKFLKDILEYADRHPEKSQAECIVKIESRLKPEELNKVLYSPPNITGLKWNFFASRDERMAKLIRQAKEKVGPTEEQYLLLHKTKSYGAC